MGNVNPAKRPYHFKNSGGETSPTGGKGTVRGNREQQKIIKALFLHPAYSPQIIKEALRQYNEALKNADLSGSPMLAVLEECKQVLQQMVEIIEGD